MPPPQSNPSHPKHRVFLISSLRASQRERELGGAQQVPRAATASMVSSLATASTAARMTAPRVEEKAAVVSVPHAAPAPSRKHAPRRDLLLA